MVSWDDRIASIHIDIILEQQKPRKHNPRVVHLLEPHGYAIKN